MKFTSLLNLASAALFTIATLAILLAFAEGIVQLLGVTLISNAYAPGRILELAAVLLVFVAVNHLRQIRDVLQQNSST